MENLGIKTLDELIAAREALLNEIFCHENGDDSYYNSPLYSQHSFRLNTLNQEIDRLTGKAA